MRESIRGDLLARLKNAEVVEIRHEGLEFELYADGVSIFGHREEGSVIPPC